MTFARLRRYDIIEVVWIDTWSPESRTWILDHQHEEGTLEIRTVAIFCSQNNEYLYTYGSMTTDKGISTMLQSPFHIPRGCIKSLKILKSASKKDQADATL